MSLQYTQEQEVVENFVNQIPRPLGRLVGGLTEPRTKTQLGTQTTTATQRHQLMLLEIINEGITLCSTKTLTLADVEKNQ